MRATHKLDIFKSFMNDLASLSTCKRKSAGAIVFPSDFSAVYAIGYNGPPRGLPNESCTATEGDCGCIHAEANAMIKMPSYVVDCTMLCTMSPCVQCAGLIINSQQISRVLYLHEYRKLHGLWRLEEAGLEVQQV